MEVQVARKPAQPRLNGHDDTTAERGRERTKQVPVRASSARPPVRTPSPSTKANSKPAPPPSLTLNLDNFEAYEPIRQVLTSPRSLEVCAACGIHPTELLPRHVSQFQGPGIQPSIAQMRFEHYEQRRVEKRDLLREERNARINVSREVSAPPEAMQCAPKPTEQTQFAPPSRLHDGVDLSVGSNIDSSISREMVVARARAVIDREKSRQLVYERAQLRQAEREHTLMEKHFAQSQKAEQLRLLMAEERQRQIEGRRLRRLDAMEQVEQLRRIRDYDSQRKFVQMTERLNAATAINRGIRIAVAKEQYMTPRQRAEKRRSSSAHR